MDALRLQLEAAKKEEALPRRRSAADELRRQIAAQQESNARLRGRTKSDTFQSDSMRNLPRSQTQDKDKALGDEQMNIDILRKSKKLRKLVKKDLKKLNLLDEASSDSCDCSEGLSKGIDRSDSAGPGKRTIKTKDTSDSSQGSAGSDISVSYSSSDSSSGKKKKNKKKKSGIRAKASDTVRYPQR